MVCQPIADTALLAFTDIIQLFGVALDDAKCLCLLMELADSGSLRQLLSERPKVVVGVSSVQMPLAHDVASGLAYLHAELSMLHHDIKSANVCKPNSPPYLIRSDAPFACQLF